jgi:hypothetical protein
MFSTLFTLALCLTLAFSVCVIALVLTNTSIRFAFNPYVAQLGWYHGQLLLGRYRIVFTRHA